MIIQDEKLRLAIEKINEEWEKEYGENLKKLYEKQRECELIIKSAPEKWDAWKEWWKERDVWEFRERIEKELKGINSFIEYLDFQHRSRIDRVKNQICEHKWEYKEDFSAFYQECKKCGLKKKILDYDGGYEGI